MKAKFEKALNEMRKRNLGEELGKVETLEAILENWSAYVKGDKKLTYQALEMIK